MVGLDKKILDSFDFELSLKRIKEDMRSDFILSLQYKHIFENYGSELCEHLSDLLSSGRYGIRLPKFINVPKPSGIIRIGSILEPLDRLLYQCIADYIAPVIEKNINRNMVYSNVLIENDIEGKMFKPRKESYDRFKEAIENNCKNKEFKFAIKTDIASFFDMINQHTIINSLKSFNIAHEVINLLEKMLSGFRETSSQGIIQGVFPSDLLGNFYLQNLDYQFILDKITSIRYVDDIYIFLKTKNECLKVLEELCTRLKSEGLFLNEFKTKIDSTPKMYHRETELERLLEEVGKDFEGEEDISTYGIDDWDEDEEPEEIIIDDQKLSNVEELYRRHSEASSQRDRIIKFCLPILGKGRSEVALDDAFNYIEELPHLTRSYCIYLERLSVSSDYYLMDKICSLITSKNIVYGWQYFWIYFILLYHKSVKKDLIDIAVKHVKDKRLPEYLRGIAAIIINKFGNLSQRKILRNEYSNESSNYVRSSILYSIKYLPSNDECRACRKAWGSHSFENSLLARVTK